MLKLRKAGVTLIEAMLAMTLLSVATVGFLQLEKTKAKKELQTNYEYELKKFLKGIDSKLMEDKLRDKRYWKELSFTEINFQNHMKYNLIDKDSRCAKEALKHVDMDRTYIPCHLNLNTKIFKSSISGNIEFAKDDSFKKYTLRFTPKGDLGIKELKPLSKIAKRALNDINMYSDVNFITKEVSEYKSSSYLDCVKFKKDCFLLVTFGSKYDYLEPEKEKQEKVVSNKMISITDGTYEEVETTNSKYKITEYENVKDVLDDHGVETDKKQLREFEKAIDDLKNNEEFVAQLEAQLQHKCSAYDEDDYYFMSMYEKDNPCFIYKTKGLHGEM